MNIEEFSNEFVKQAEKVDIKINENQIKKFYDYMNLLIEWNDKINLTAITEPKEVIVKHFIDSILAAKYIKDDSSIIDVGTGAGFPGIPLKIFNNNYKITLLDSLNKRTIFLQEVVNKLGLENVEIIHGRAEDYAQDKKYREMYDYAISRAVAPLNILLEYLVPYTKVDGCVIAMKGSNAEQELVEAKNAINKLGAEAREKDIIQLPEDSGERYILVFGKKEHTNKIYPRKAGTPKKSPL
ncbi:MAG: 16S rRNA (guanine(527)-N(7))-methyltransferase RsmG [Clostridia bacterium]|nr:16S rRNA (guanine(527)-N(7))-methyltransferase RsmG [Clostridia bacterium]